MEKAASNQKVAVSLNLEKGTDMLRKSGIEVVGDVPWGTHFCQFYETKEDLIDVLVPYFKVGLENNEFCMWVTSKPLTEEEAKKAMRKAVPNFDRYLKRGQMEIVPHSDWYLKDGAFNLQRVLGAWIDKLDQALAERYDGIRVTGNTAWLERQDWKSFTCYEEGVNSVIGKHRMIAICTYSLDKCGASEVIDVVRNHQFALIKRMGEWELIESSELKRAKEDLEKSEMLLKKTFAASPDAIAVSDLNGNIVECNEQTLNLHGYSSKEELIGKSALELIAKKDHKSAMENLKKTLEQGSVRNIEYTFLTKDGREFPAELSASLIKDSSGKPTGFVAITKDITERKKAEEELIRLSNAVKMSADSIVIGDLDAKIIDVNEVTLKMHGTDNKRDLIGKSSFDLIAPEDREKALAGMKEVLEKEYIKGREYNIITKDGSRIPVEMNTAIMKDVDGKPIGFVAISRDITERKEMEEKLRQYSEHLEELVQKGTKELLESEKRYSVLVEEASDGVVIFQDEKIAFTNKKGAELIGYSKGELLGVTFEKLVSEKHRLIVKKRYDERLRGDKVPETLEIELIAKTGEYIPIELTGALVDYQGRPADLLIVRDVRERKRLEEQRLKLEKLATMGELATMVAHDLRNPLTSIRNAGYYIKNTCPYRTNTECKTTLEMLNIIEQETIFANNIINDLLDFAAKRPLQKKRQNINEIIEDSLTKGNIPRNIEVERNFKKAIIGVDEKQLQRVFLNLIKNAVQAMPDGGKLAVTTKETKDNVEIIFADTGIGISEENISKLFTPLFTTKAKGIGMGLAICKNIVEQHNGTIEVKNKLSQGTTFTIKLPKKEEANNQ